MSFILQYSSFTKTELSILRKRITITEKGSLYNDNPKKHLCYYVDEEDDSLYLPLGLWKEYVLEEYGFPNGKLNEYPKMNNDAKFTKKLLTPSTDPQARGRNQVAIVKETLTKLTQNNSVFMSIYTGAGKTAMAIYISIYLGKKTAVICHLKEVRGQWPREYNKYSSSSVKVQNVKGKGCKLDPTADVYIIGINKASKMDVDDFKDIGTVIVDEAHMVTITAFTVVLFKFQPLYLIGLSATPDRNDGMHALFKLYFSSPKDYVVREEKKDFTVYRYNTSIKPEWGYKIYKGRYILDWYTIQKSLEENQLRWELVADICQNHPKEVIIVFCLWNVFAEGLYEILKGRKEHVALLIGKTTKWDRKARIIVAGLKKGGTGLDHPGLSMAIVASDTKDVRQYEGRIRISDGIIYHLVDNHPKIKEHYKICEKWYQRRGATIKEIGHYTDHEDEDKEEIVVTSFLNNNQRDVLS